MGLLSCYLPISLSFSTHSSSFVALAALRKARISHVYYWCDVLLSGVCDIFRIDVRYLRFLRGSYVIASIRDLRLGRTMKRAFIINTHMNAGNYILLLLLLSHYRERAFRRVRRGTYTTTPAAPQYRSDRSVITLHPPL